jgi:dihydroneopterin aldolase
MAIIEIDNMEFHANHGHYKEEQLIGNTFLVNLRIEYNSENAQKSDNLKDTVNYQVAFEIVKREMGRKSHLLEHVGNRILESLFQELAGIESAEVKVSKVNPPMGGKIEKVSVTLDRKRYKND